MGKSSLNTELGNIDAGYGVFAGRNYKKEEPVEICPYFRMLDKDIPECFNSYKFLDFEVGEGSS